MIVSLANAVSFAETISTETRFAHRNQCGHLPLENYHTITFMP